MCLSFPISTLGGVLGPEDVPVRKVPVYFMLTVGIGGVLSTFSVLIYLIPRVTQGGGYFYWKVWSREAENRGLGLTVSKKQRQGTHSRGLAPGAML